MVCHVESVAGGAKSLVMAVWNASTGVLLRNTSPVAAAAGLVSASLTSSLNLVSGTMYYYGVLLTSSDGQNVGFYSEDISASPLNNAPRAAGLATLATAATASNITVPINSQSSAIWVAAR